MIICCHSSKSVESKKLQQCSSWVKQKLFSNNASTNEKGQEQKTTTKFIKEKMRVSFDTSGEIFGL